MSTHRLRPTGPGTIAFPVAQHSFAVVLMTGVHDSATRALGRGAPDVKAVVPSRYDRTVDRLIQNSMVLADPSILSLDVDHLEVCAAEAGLRVAYLSELQRPMWRYLAANPQLLRNGVWCPRLDPVSDALELRSFLESQRIVFYFTSQIATRFTTLPLRVAELCLVCCLFARHFADVASALRFVQISRSAVSRGLARAGLCSVHEILRCARVAHAILPLREKRDAAVVARTSGFGSLRTLLRALRATTRLLLTEVRSSDPYELADALWIGSVRKSTSGAGADSECSSVYLRSGTSECDGARRHAITKSR